MCHCTAPEANEESVSAGNLAGLIEQFPPNERKLRIGSDDALDHCDAGAGSPRGFAGEDRRSMPPRARETTEEKSEDSNPSVVAGTGVGDYRALSVSQQLPLLLGASIGRVAPPR
jgi:hypothetical protein